MAYLDSQTHPVWKQQLLDGVIHTHTAEAVAQRLAGLHAASARNPALLYRFDHDDDFVAIRLSPYFLHTARQQPSVANSLEQLVAQTLAHRSVLVHGDVSPKNVLVGPLGPVFLDAECACWGDPAFDLAFVLNHLLLKAVWQPAYAPALRSSFDALHTAYLAAVDWEDRDALEARTCHVLAGLLLARIDGKSPVEYLTQTHQHDFVRRQAMAWLHQPAKRLAHMALAWNPS
jgi:aminoglycoside phosphotransferase (APT) family kinase protein